MEGLEKSNWVRNLFANSTRGRRVPGPRLQRTHADVHLYKHTAKQGLTNTCALLTFTHADIFSLRSLEKYFSSSKILYAPIDEGFVFTNLELLLLSFKITFRVSIFSKHEILPHV